MTPGDVCVLQLLTLYSVLALRETIAGRLSTYPEMSGPDISTLTASRIRLLFPMVSEVDIIGFVSFVLTFKNCPAPNGGQDAN